MKKNIYGLSLEELTSEMVMLGQSLIELNNYIVGFMSKKLNRLMK